MERLADRQPRSPAALVAMALLASSLGCTSKAPAPAAPVPGSPPEASAPGTTPDAAPAQAGLHMASQAFMQSLLGTLPLAQVKSPKALDDFSQARTWTSSSSNGSMLLEAWTSPTASGSQVDALEFDPTTANYHVLGLDPGGSVDESPAIAGGPNGSAMVLWTRQISSSNNAAVVGQVFDSSGEGGARWSYSQGNGRPIGDTALAGGPNGFVALWTQAQSDGRVLLAQPLDASGGQVGNPTLVSNVQGDPSQPDIVAGSNGFLAVWADRASGSARIYGTLLTASGQSQASPFPISDGSPAVSTPRVMWDGSQYWVSWYDARAGVPGAYDAFVQTVSSGGGLVGSNVRVSDHRMKPSSVAPRVVPQGSSYLVLFAGQDLDDQDPTALAPSAVYGSVLTAGATPSVPFAITPIDSSSLVDAQPSTSNMVLLSQDATGSGQTELDWSEYSLPGASYTSPFSGFSSNPYGSTLNFQSSYSTSSGNLGYGYNGTGAGYLDTLQPGNPYLP